MFVSPGVDDLIGNTRTTMQQVLRMTCRQLFIHVQERNLPHNSTGLQCEGGTRSNQPSSANDTDFHRFNAFFYHDSFLEQRFTSPLAQVLHHPIGDCLDQSLLIHFTIVPGCSGRGDGRCVEGASCNASSLPTLAENIVGADIAILILFGVTRI